MNNKAIHYIGIALFVIGLALTSLTSSPTARTFGAFATVAGFLLTKGFGIWARTGRHPIGPIEKFVYAMAATLTVAVFTAGLLGYFNDVLTYSFAAALFVAIGFMLRRIFL